MKSAAFVFAFSYQKENPSKAQDSYNVAEDGLVLTVFALSTMHPDDA